MTRPGPPRSSRPKADGSSGAIALSGTPVRRSRCRNDAWTVAGVSGPGSTAGSNTEVCMRAVGKRRASRPATFSAPPRWVK